MPSCRSAAPMDLLLPYALRFSGLELFEEAFAQQIIKTVGMLSHGASRRKADDFSTQAAFFRVILIGLTMVRVRGGGKPFF
jgi:hypothetical protein